MDAEMIGVAACSLGAGRATKVDVIDHAAGIMLSKKTGDKVKKGEVIAHLYSNKECDLTREYLSAITFSDIAPEPLPLIYK